MSEAVLTWLGRAGASTKTAITYSRPSTGQSLSGISATVGSTPYETVGSDGVIVAYQSRDYIFAASVLTFDGGSTFTLPAENDMITEAASGLVYRVSVPSGSNHYERLGPNGEAFSVHTKGPV